MMKFVLSVILFITISAGAQAPFKLKAFYPKNDIVEYPLGQTPRSLWIVVKDGGILATAYPVEGSVWNKQDDPRYKPTPPIPTPVPIPTPTGDVVTTRAFDSLFNAYRAKNDSLNTRIDGFNATVTGILKNMREMQQQPAADTIQATQSDFPLLYRVSNGTYRIRAIQLGAGLTGKLTDNAIVISIGTAAPVKTATPVKATATKPSIKAPKTIKK